MHWWTIESKSYENRNWKQLAGNTWSKKFTAQAIAQIKSCRVVSFATQGCTAPFRLRTELQLSMCKWCRQQDWHIYVSRQVEVTKENVASAELLRLSRCLLWKELILGFFLTVSLALYFSLLSVSMNSPHFFISSSPARALDVIPNVTKVDIKERPPTFRLLLLISHWSHASHLVRL